MWRIDTARIDENTIRCNRLAGVDGDLSFGDVAQAWRADEAFRSFWMDSLREVPIGAYCWECPPVDEARRGRRFECVFISSPSLARMPLDPAAFAEYFRDDREAVTFANLGGDAVLVAPCPDPAGGNFGHLASFTATAPPSLQQALWKEVGRALDARIGARPLWLSTAGHGVAWLHVRLDSSPKYYQHVPYRQA
ncbi:MAG: hypothetical protein FJ171_07065 [Gammaproteobacteria bacterium]|nr:hypothetical protein [Gammaproteobacteria bacterium]